MEAKNPFDDIAGGHGCILSDLETGEIPLLLIRKHWVVLLGIFMLVLIIVGLCISIILFGLLGNLHPLFTWLTAIGVGMVGIQYIFVQWTNNEFDIFIITNKRIIAYEQIKLLNRKMSQASIDQVQEVQASTNGFFGNILRYGNMVVKTAGDASDFQLTTIPKALETSRIIHTLIDEHRHDLGEPNK